MSTSSKIKTFADALEVLGLEEYEERIVNSNSHGELFHLLDYLTLAEHVAIHPEQKEEIKFRFEAAVKVADETWERPDSIFQHLNEVFK